MNDYYYRLVIDLLKAHIKHEPCNPDAAILTLGKALDRAIVNNEPSDYLRNLYDDAVWLKCQLPE